MAKNDPVTEEECDSKLEKVYNRINSMERSLSKIFGALAAIMFLSTFIVTFVGFHINQRFSGVEKSVDKLDERLIGYIDSKPEG